MEPEWPCGLSLMNALPRDILAKKVGMPRLPQENCFSWHLPLEFLGLHSQKLTATPIHSLIPSSGCLLRTFYVPSTVPKLQKLMQGRFWNSHQFFVFTYPWPLHLVSLPLPHAAAVLCLKCHRIQFTKLSPNPVIPGPLLVLSLLAPGVWLCSGI